MSSQQNYGQQFNRADTNHDGTIDEGEFRHFLGPVIKDERRLSGTLTPQDLQKFNTSGGNATQTITYEVGLDVAVAGFVQNPIEYEKYTHGPNTSEAHTYGVGPDVGIGAPNVARRSSQYDPAGAMFNYADVNSDGKIDPQEFGTLMRSV